MLFRSEHFAQWFGGEQDFLARRGDIVFIGFQESLTADFEKLKMKLGLPASVAAVTPRGPPARHRLEVEVYYVSRDSTGARDVPSLRRKRLVGGTAGPRFEDEELAPGISRLQVTPVAPAADGSSRVLQILVEWQALRDSPGLRPARRFVWIRNGRATPWP